MRRRVTILNGSPKGPEGASGSLARYLEDRLVGRGANVRTFIIRDALMEESSTDEMLETCHQSDAMVLVFPVHCHTVPAGCLRAMTLLRRRYSRSLPNQGVVAICNGGLPEASGCEQAIGTVFDFCAEVGVESLGGVGMPCAQSLRGRPLGTAGGGFKGHRHALDIIARSIENGEHVPDEAVLLMSRRPMPRFIYRIIENRRRKGEARMNGVFKTIRDRPYE